jgi:hypothetical protein
MPSSSSVLTERGNVISYSVVLLALHGGAWRTVRVYDNAHGANEMHRYTLAGGKQPAELVHAAPPEEARRGIRRRACPSSGGAPRAASRRPSLAQGSRKSALSPRSADPTDAASAAPRGHSDDKRGLEKCSSLLLSDCSVVLVLESFPFAWRGLCAAGDMSLVTARFVTSS